MADGLAVAMLGGYGQIGRAPARCLLRDGARSVAIAGHSAARADEAVQDIPTEVRAGAVRGQAADAGDEAAVAALLNDHDVLIHVAPLPTAVADALRPALLQTGGRAVLISHDPGAVAMLRHAAPALQQAGARVIADAGADPSLQGVAGELAACVHGAAEVIEISARYRAPQIGRIGLEDILDSAAAGGWRYAGGWRTPARGKCGGSPGRAVWAGHGPFRCTCPNWTR